MAISRHNLVPDLPDNNFATLNPLVVWHDLQLRHGNLDATIVASSGNQSAGTIATMSNHTNCLTYVEFLPVTMDSNHNIYFGVMPTEQSSTRIAEGWQYGMTFLQWSGSYTPTSYLGTSPWSAGVGPSFSNGQVVGLTWNPFKGEMNVYVDGQFAHSFVTSYYVNKEISFVHIPATGTSGTSHSVVNFGQNPDFCDNKTDYSGGNNPDGSWSDANGIGRFHYQPPAGALALCSRNLQPAVSFRGYDFEETGKALTYNGNVEISKNSPYVGGGSYEFADSSITVDSSHNDDWNFGSGDFTVEFWYYARAYNLHNTWGRRILSTRDDGYNGGWKIDLQTDGAKINLSLIHI